MGWRDNVKPITKSFESKPGWVERDCEICGRPFWVTPSYLRFASGRYCSNGCKTLAGRKPRSCSPKIDKSHKPIIKRCVVCDTEFSVSYHQRDQILNCSSRCQGIYRMLMRQQEVSEHLGRSVDEVIREYYATDMTIRDIAKKIGISYLTLLKWMDHFGIAKKTRSEAIKTSWRNADERRQRFASDIKNTQDKMEAGDPGWTKRQAMKARLANQSHKTSGIELKLMKALDDLHITYESQYSVNDRFLCDLRIEDTTLIVECDGDYWHSLPRVQANDKRKNAYLKTCGYTVMRFSETEINDDASACARRIRDWLAASSGGVFVE